MFAVDIHQDVRRYCCGNYMYGVQTTYSYMHHRNMAYQTIHWQMNGQSSAYWTICWQTKSRSVKSMTGQHVDMRIITLYLYITPNRNPNSNPI